MITIPTITTIRDQIITDIEAKIGQTIPSSPKAFFRVLAYALAGVLNQIYRIGAWIYNQIFPQTADDEALANLGGQYGIVRRPAVAAKLTATATGANDTVIPSGTLWQRNGTVYQQTVDVSISGGTATVTVEALTTGEATNASNGTIISLTTPIAGVVDNATVVSTVTTGEDVEDIEIYRSRILQFLQARPQGGSVADYVAWALEVAGIVKAFAFNTAAGEVTVYPLISLTGTRIPDAGKLAEVDAYIEHPDRKPLCATVVTAAMTERIITMVVTGLTPDTIDLRSAIESAWESYLLERFPLQYADESMPTNIISLAGMYAEAIGAGASGLVATMSVDGVPGTITQYQLAESEIVKLGGITWPV